MQIDKSTIKNILIIRPEMIGDYVIITPVITALKKAYPAARITIWLKEFTRPLAETNPDIDKIITDPRQIKKGQFDLAVDLWGDPSGAVLAWRRRIPYRLGDSSRFVSRWFYNIKVFINWQNFTRHYLEYYLEMLVPLGIENATPKISVTPTETALASIKKLIPENIFAGGLIGLHVGTGGGNRSWTTQNFAALADQIEAELHFKVLLLGGKKEEEKARQIVSLCQSAPINLANKISLPQLVAVLSRLKLYVGSDTGPFHLAAGLGLPIVAIMPTKFVKPTQWGPWNTPNIILRPNNPCDKICNPRTCLDTQCLEKITPDDVLSAIKTLLSGGGNRTLKQSKADWLKKSLRILVVSSQNNAATLAQTLTRAGFKVYLTPKISFWKLLSLLIEKDINLVRFCGTGSTLGLRLALTLAGLKTNFPIMFVSKHKPFKINDAKPK